MNWQSSKVKLPTFMRATSQASATFEASVAVEEHALAEEGAAELYSVESAGERAIAPDFDRMGMARSVQREHRMFELGVDPRLLALRAGGDHRGKILVAGDRETVRPDGPPERPRDVEPVERDDRAVTRFDPEQLGGGAAVGHRKDAAGIALEQKARIEPGSCAPSLQISRAPRPAVGTGGRLCPSRPAGG